MHKFSNSRPDWWLLFLEKRRRGQWKAVADIRQNPPKVVPRNWRLSDQKDWLKQSTLLFFLLFPFEQTKQHQPSSNFTVNCTLILNLVRLWKKAIVGRSRISSAKQSTAHKIGLLHKKQCSEVCSVKGQRSLTRQASFTHIPLLFCRMSLF